jgi:hypothetical protein
MASAVKWRAIFSSLVPASLNVEIVLYGDPTKLLSHVSPGIQSRVRFCVKQIALQIHQPMDQICENPGDSNGDVAGLGVG